MISVKNYLKPKVDIIINCIVKYSFSKNKIADLTILI